MLLLVGGATLLSRLLAWITGVAQATHKSFAASGDSEVFRRSVYAELFFWVVGIGLTTLGIYFLRM